MGNDPKQWQWSRLHITLGKFEVFVQVENAFADTLKFSLASGTNAPGPRRLN